jgi:hypothetical protein
MWSFGFCYERIEEKIKDFLYRLDLRGFDFDKYSRFNSFFCFSLLRDIVFREIPIDLNRIHLSLHLHPIKNRLQILFSFGMMAPLCIRNIFFFLTNMSHPIEFHPKMDDKNEKHNCKLDAFFQFYCSIVTNRSNNYMARLPAFGQCVSTNHKK